MKVGGEMRELGTERKEERRKKKEEGDWRPIYEVKISTDFATKLFS